MTPRGRNPYDGFKDDRARLYALMSRDVRLVLIYAFWALCASGAIPFGRAFLRMIF